MAHVSITDRLLTVELHGLHRVWALKRRIQVPLSHVRGATADPGIATEPKGVRAPGLRLPGVAIGTFYREGEKHFWDVRSGRHAIVIELVGEAYTRLIVDVDDPRATVDMINRALSPSRTAH